VEVVTCVLEDDIERETAEMFLLALGVSVTLMARVALVEVDDATV
jgi:hypothetical protein